MLVRTKNGIFPVSDSGGLLKYLGVKDFVPGKRIETEGIEIIASASFSLAAGEETKEGIAFTFSTFDLDRYYERIDPAGWKLDNYLKNPVVQWAHRYEIPAIGIAENIHADEKGLHGIVVFNDKEFDLFGWSIGERVKRGILRAVSVGFRILEIELPSKKDSEDGTMLIFRKQELLENSICNVPANPAALIKPMALAKSIEKTAAEPTEDLDFPSFWGNIINNFEGVKNG